MLAQIQTYFSHFFGKLVALALFLFILTSFNLQILTANAQGTTTPVKTTSPTPDTKSTATSTNLTDKQVNDKIGTLKNCSVDNKSPDYQKKLKEDPTEANNFVFQCLKDIIQIVITISIILAIMRLIFVGIKFLNTFDDGPKLQAELAKAISGFIAGAVILGLFAAIINVINPSALKIDKIFSAQVIADYKCLNKGISDNNANTVNKAGCTDSNSNKPGPSTSKNSYASENILSLLDNKKPTPEQAKEIDTIKAKIKECLTDSNGTDCLPYIQAVEINPSLVVGDYQTLTPRINKDLYASGTYKINTGAEEKTFAGKYTNSANKSESSFVVTYSGDNCKKTPLTDNLSRQEIKSGEQLNFAPCVLTIQYSGK